MRESHPPGAGSWPTRRSATLDWLIQETRTQPFADNLFGEFCARLDAEGLPLARATLHLRVLHPQFLGATFLWRRGMAQPEMSRHEPSARDSDAYRNSPLHALDEGAEGIRRRLDLGATENEPEFAIYADLRAQGLTDYVALPLVFTSGQRHVCTWATDRKGGFTTRHLVEINDMLPALAMAIEIRANRRTTKNVLNAYVGMRAGERILAGDIRRGSGETIRAAIWNSDLRGFTQISELWPRDEVIGWLNEYFDIMAAPVDQHGGEILKFIGDGMLAIFPLESDAACFHALQAAIEAREGMRALNLRRLERDQFELGFGLALHVGDVMYGNIGTTARLDFTVIGPAVNVASRLQEVAKELKRKVVLSAPFAGLCACSADLLTSLGRFPLRGVGEPMGVFGLADER